ncbi:MAG: chemotaxis protein CheX [Planctomycetota bacterium]
MSDTAEAPFDPRLIVPFVNSVRQVMKTMVNLETTVERPKIKSDPVSSFDVSAIVNFSGDVVGSVVLSFEQDAAVKIVEKFAGTAMDPQSADFADAIGELGNMVAGAAKKGLGYDASIGIPSVIVGQGHHVARLKDVPCLVVPCTSEAGSFAVEVSIRRADAAVRQAA